MTGNEKLCKIYFKKLFFQNVLAFIDLFYRYHYIGYFIYSDCMWRHVYTICTEEATRGVLETFVSFTGKRPINQKPTTITPHMLNYAISLVLVLSGSSQPLGWLTSLSHSTWLTPKQKDKTLYSPSLLVSLSYTRN